MNIYELVKESSIVSSKAFLRQGVPSMGLRSYLKNLIRVMPAEEEEKKHTEGLLMKVFCVCRFMVI